MVCFEFHLLLKLQFDAYAFELQFQPMAEESKQWKYCIIGVSVTVKQRIEQ